MRQHSAILLLVVVSAGAAIWMFTRPNPRREASKVRELATRVLAGHLARAHAGKSALVVSNPFTQWPGADKTTLEMEEAGLRGLREGFGEKLKVKVDFPELKAGARENPASLLAEAETTTPLSYLVATNAFADLARKHGDCEILVSLIGLPLGLTTCEAWTSDGPPRFALLLPDFRGIADSSAVQKAMKSGKLAAFVFPKPGGLTDDSPLGEDAQAEFQRRFILVTPDNIDQVIKSQPELF